MPNGAKVKMTFGIRCDVSKQMLMLTRTQLHFPVLLSCISYQILHYYPESCKARQCSPLRRKFMECTINNPALLLLMKYLVIGQHQKPPNFSAFHWLPHGSLVSIGQNFVTTWIAHIPKRTKTSLITESDQSGPNHQLLQLCTTRTAWSASDQAVRAVHSCISWLVF